MTASLAALQRPDLDADAAMSVFRAAAHAHDATRAETRLERVLGGIGGYTGTILGALILAVLDTMLNLLTVDEPVKQILYGAIILTLTRA